MRRASVCCSMMTTPCRTTHSFSPPAPAMLISAMTNGSRSRPRGILVAFERAERETDPQRRAALLTFVIVGAGPTGVELAGTIAELAQDTLPPDFRNIDTHKARVVLIEAGPRVLAGFPDELSAYAQNTLQGT